MNRLKKTIAVSCLLSLVITVLAPSSFAFRASVGAVSGHKKLTEGMGNGNDDLTFSPLLLEMAKLIGRTGLPRGFFLQNDSAFPDESGVDLRTLLLYQAGLIKMPIRLVTGGRKEGARADAPPLLLLPSIPEPRREMSREQPVEFPSVASTPLPREPERSQVVTPKASVGSPDKIRIADSPAGTRPVPAPLLSMDLARLEPDATAQRDDFARGPALAVDLPQLAMAMPRTNAMPFITRNTFRLWTHRTDEKASLEKGNAAAPVEFTGTFVVATTGAIKSITGRHFVMAPGKLLASNQGGELLFKTTVGTVSVELNATAIVEVMQKGTNKTLKVYALESRDGAGVSIEVPGTRPQSFRLTSGEALIVGDHPLTAEEVQGQVISKKLNPTTAKGSFTVKDFVEHELIASPKVQIHDSEHYSALTSLKGRVGHLH